MNSNYDLPLSARLASSLPDLTAAPGDVPAQLPAEVQWMPPGEHEITALQGEQVVTTRVTVNEQTARVLQATLENFLARAAEGAGDKPYLDFNHDDAEAAGHVTAFSWGGDDPVQGGVRARVEWTGPGRAALTGHAYRRFSPAFFINAAGEVTGAPVNMGGLVNRAAFKTIQPIWSRSADQTQPKGTMPAHNAPATNPAGAPASAPENLAALITALTTRVAALEKRLKPTPDEGEAAAPEPEKTALTARIAELEGQLTNRAKEVAQARVNAAILAGKLPPQATPLHARWVEALTANPGLGEILDALPVQAALATIVTSPARGGNQASAAGTHEFVLRAQAVAGERKLTNAQAFALVAREQPALYDAYRSALANH